MKKLFAALAVVPLLGISGAALAGEPVQLTTGQMDDVTAGALSGALIHLSAIATGTRQAFAGVEGSGQIVQTAVPIATPFGVLNLQRGDVLARGASNSSN